jgi:hypothetical protein
MKNASGPVGQARKHWRQAGRLPDIRILTMQSGNHLMQLELLFKLALPWLNSAKVIQSTESKQVLLTIHNCLFAIAHGKIEVR